MAHRLLAPCRMARFARGLILTVVATACSGPLAGAAEESGASPGTRCAPAAPPAVARRGLLLEARMGVNYTQAGWAATSTDVFPSATAGLGPELRLRVGGLVWPRVALIAEAAASAPLVPGGIAVAGLGAGARWFAGATGSFHVDAGVRRAWGYRYGIGTVGLPIREIWLLEMGVGSVARAGQVDRGWSVALFGGVVPKVTGHGHAAGVSLTHGWSWL